MDAIVFAILHRFQLYRDVACIIDRPNLDYFDGQIRGRLYIQRLGWPQFTDPPGQQLGGKFDEFRDFDPQFQRGVPGFFAIRLNIEQDVLLAFLIPDDEGRL